MTCVDRQKLLTDYVHHQLDAARDAEMYEHVRSCEACRAALDAELELSAAVRAAFAAEFEMPTSVLAGVRQAIRSEQAPSPLARLRLVLRPVVLAPAAAAILIAAIIGYGEVHRQGQLPTLSSDYFVREHVAQTIGSQSSDRAWSAYLLTSANAESASDATAGGGN
jgi:anti-sigma factor RsiW